NATPTDCALVDAARAGCGDSFGALVERYRHSVLRIAQRLTNDRDEAHDTAQDALLRAFVRLPELQPDREFAPWLFVIARNASFDDLRRRKRATILSERSKVACSAAGPPVEIGPEAGLVRRDEFVRVHDALAHLPDKYRRVLELYYVAGVAYRDIATDLNMPLATVKTHIRPSGGAYPSRSIPITHATMP
ncbi:MAG: sigma-70 family RNA polymerase sigma factor, partial [Candidatus Eremiobacteraeota bacterium]|nr:sigma-70 family RNA polymerase sigma factor [Candidatus Eremiobacteraeota bacterium]